MNLFLRICCSSPDLRVCDIGYNAASLEKAMRSAAAKGAGIVLFPELCLTAYTCGDLFSHTRLQSAALEALSQIAEASKRHGIYSIVGLPFAHRGRLYNCAAVVGNGRTLGLVPKQYLPNTGEYYEQRWFCSGLGHEGTVVLVNKEEVPFGTDLLFEDPTSGCTFGVEICEDLWATTPPSGSLCLAGANLILNPSASNELIGKAAYRRDLVVQQSARCLAAYAYASAGPGESTTDVVISGHCMVAENGVMLAESDRFCFETQLICADVDFQRLENDRHRSSSFAVGNSARSFRRIAVNIPQPAKRKSSKLLRPNSPHPFVPSDQNVRAEVCREIFSIQSAGLAKRLKHTGVKSVVIGISGGLDSTLALLVTVHAFDLLGLKRGGILAPTMPGFGTTRRTRSNAEKLVEQLGATLRLIPIEPSVRQHFKDIGHAESRHDLVFENAQARERTQILMDLSNQVNGLVVGTGDLSEAALGWCTFNGDHMSMYHVNIGIPKTLVRYLVEWCADTEFSGAPSKVLHDIAATPISPELLPTSKDGQLTQHTEDVIGPYELHDYFLYHFVRHGYPPAKLLFLAENAFQGRYERRIILKWLEVFVGRFFSQQFKRSAMPDGPKVGSVALSPRGDWRMPSDASASAWIEELDALKRISVRKR
jgi:NAD+ synthase (glutamine-hydrolysing)